jgi:signal transduction histidine kinase
LTPPEYAELNQRALKELAESGVCRAFEKEYIRKDGLRVPVLIGAAVFDDSPDDGAAFVLDLTERKKLEKQFRQAQKMEAIGNLAGGVAHDFNNVLAIIQLQAHCLKMSKSVSAKQSELIDNIILAVERAAGLTRQLLLFGSREALRPTYINLTESISRTIEMLKRLVGEQIDMQLKMAVQPIFLHADAAMMDQVLLNLVVNARDAMPNGGTLVIETSAVELDEFAASHSAQARPGSFVCLRVSDSGCGIPPEHLSRIFEPFFTTKDIGKGTGLGLSTVFGIVQQHHGWINVYSEVGHGTTFRVYFPKINEEVKSDSPELDRNAACGGNETILLVEDDPGLRGSIRAVLSELGYRVVEARDGSAAVDHSKDHDDHIHLLLTDLVMPGGMSGRQLAQALIRERPRLKVAYMSGYSVEVADKKFPISEGVNFLSKPFPAAALAEMVRTCLDSS